MRRMLTPFVLGSVISGGMTVLSLPLALGFLTSLRYPQAHRVVRSDETGQRDSVSASGLPRHRPPKVIRRLSLSGAMAAGAFLEPVIPVGRHTRVTDGQCRLACGSWVSGSGPLKPILDDGPA